MPAQSTSKMQVQAYRFGMRRLENAVANGQSYKRSLGGPRPNLSFLVGFLLAALALAGFAVYALISPEPSIGDAKVLVDSDNGASYVLRGKTLYPALNITSALLAAGNSTDAASGDAGTSKPKISAVDADTLARMPKGRTLGIEGAPTRLPTGSQFVSGTWTVCDTSTVDLAKSPTQTPRVSTTVVLGQTPRPQSSVGNEAALVSPDNGANVYLLAFGRAQQIPVGNRAVAVALNTIGVKVRPVSKGLLSAIPPAPVLTQPVIPDANTGKPSPLGANIPVGTVFRVQYAQGHVDYVALDNGAQQLTPLLSDLIRAEDPSAAQIPFVPLSTLKQTNLVDSAINLANYPSSRPAFRSVERKQVICMGWNGGSSDTSYSVYPTSAVPVPTGGFPVATPTAGNGVANAVYLAPGHGALMGDVLPGQEASKGAQFLVTDTGVKFPVPNTTALSLLGLNKIPPRAAPQSLLNLLYTGPELSPQAASQYLGARSGG